MIATKNIAFRDKMFNYCIILGRSWIRNARQKPVIISEDYKSWYGTLHRPREYLSHAEVAFHNILSAYNKIYCMQWLFNYVWFRNSIFVGVPLFAPCQTPNLKGYGLHFGWPLPFDLYGMGESIRRLRSSQQSSPGYWVSKTSSPR
jgi:hypothetical protein